MGCSGFTGPPDFDGSSAEPDAYELCIQPRAGWTRSPNRPSSRLPVSRWLTIPTGIGGLNQRETGRREEGGGDSGQPVVL